jgi:hypothetical protein
MLTAKFNSIIILTVALLVSSACSALRPRGCINYHAFAYIGSDGNIYIYDVCNKKSAQITSDTQLRLSSGATFSGNYSLTGDSWSPNGDYILAKFRGLQNSVVLINTENREKFSLGDFEYWNWSPTGEYAALVSSGNNGYESYDEDIYVFDTNLGKEIYHDLGRAPYWSNDRGLFFLRAKQLGDRDLRVQELWRRDFAVDGSGNSTLSTLKIESINPPYLYANKISFSHDLKWAALFVPGLVDISELRIFNFDTNQFLTQGTLPLPDGTDVTRKWTTDSDFDWSPVNSVLAFCNGGGGADDAYNFLYGGALFLINEGELVAITESKCGRTQISWSPNGDKVAYLNNIGGISVVDLAGRLLFSSSNIQTKDSEDLKAQAGPWWSPDGTLISLVADNRICLAPVDEEITQLEFECVVDGSMMAWKP